MAEPQTFETYNQYIDHLWQEMNQKPDPSTLTRLIAAESCWMQEPDASAATAKPDVESIDSWAKKIESTKSFRRVMNSPDLARRIESRDTEGLMMDFHSELAGEKRKEREARRKQREAEREKQRGQNKRREEQRQRPEKQRQKQEKQRQKQEKHQERRQKQPQRQQKREQPKTKKFTGPVR